ncbi:MAG TPA: hypothetical protein VIH99_07035 [Bdellovibrionota bacterium]
MMNARMLLVVLALGTAQAGANETAHHEEDAHGQIHDAPAKSAAHKKEEHIASGLVVAMDTASAKSLRVGEIYTAGGKPAVLVGRLNQRFELSPHSVVEFDEQSNFRLLRGSAVVESHDEASLSTAGARVQFVGKTLVSYDHKEKSSSVFVLEGEARLVNPHRADGTLRLSRFRGATLVVGEILPQLIRQLDVGMVNSWLAGYSWPEAKRKELLNAMPGQPVVVKKETAKHLEETKIEDYFSSIDTADELHQPDYYEKKFDDPDKVVAEQNSKSGAGKVLSPEEAALISLPKTQIDLGFDLGPEFLTAEEKQKEVAGVDTRKPASRGPASVSPSTVAKARKKKAVVVQGDPDVNLVLERLRQVRSANPAISQVPARGRGPASVATPVVPDPVYDYSQNF